MRGLAGWGFGGVAAIVLAGPTGCGGPRIEAGLRQAGAGGAERALALDAQQACYDTSGGRASYRFDLPLPGATTGAQYRLYMRLGEGAGRHAIGTPLKKEGFEAGFLIHLKGRNAGLTECVSGTV